MSFQFANAKEANNQGKVFFNRSKFNSALACYQTASELSVPNSLNHAANLYCLGSVYKKLNDHEQAATHYKRAYQIRQTWASKNPQEKELQEDTAKAKAAWDASLNRIKLAYFIFDLKVTADGPVFFEIQRALNSNFASYDRLHPEAPLEQVIFQDLVTSAEAQGRPIYTDRGVAPGEPLLPEKIKQVALLPEKVKAGLIKSSIILLNATVDVPWLALYCEKNPEQNLIIVDDTVASLSGGKWLFMQACRASGCLIPRSWLLDSKTCQVQAEQLLATDMQYFLIKPHNATRTEGIIVVHRAHLLQFFTWLQDPTQKIPNFLQGDVETQACTYWRKNPLNAFLVQEVVIASEKYSWQERVFEPTIRIVVKRKGDQITLLKATKKFAAVSYMDGVVTTASVISRADNNAAGTQFPFDVEVTGAEFSKLQQMCQTPIQSLMRHCDQLNHEQDWQQLCTEGSLELQKLLSTYSYFKPIFLNPSLLTLLLERLEKGEITNYKPISTFLSVYFFNFNSRLLKNDQRCQGLYDYILRSLNSNHREFVYIILTVALPALGVTMKCKKSLPTYTGADKWQKFQDYHTDRAKVFEGEDATTAKLKRYYDERMLEQFSTIVSRAYAVLKETWLADRSKWSTNLKSMDEELRRDFGFDFTKGEIIRHETYPVVLGETEVLMNQLRHALLGIPSARTEELPSSSNPVVHLPF